MKNTLGALIMDLTGLSLTPEEKELLAHPLVGGVILFARNYESREQLVSLCQAIRAATTRPLLILVDQEGGRVQRFVAEFTALPPLSWIGKMDKDNPALAAQLAAEHAYVMASELLSAGIDLSLAPVLDLNKGVSTVIGDRALHSDPLVVARLAESYAQSMRDAGMAVTGKHFPGHGSVKLDSHVANPVDDREREIIWKEDLIPFARLIASGMNAVMAAHIIFPRIDVMPVGFSHYWLNDILRKQLHFQGVIFSDDLNMQGANISTNYTDRVAMAREAGCDWVLLCNNRPGVIEVINDLPYISHQLGIEKWGGLRGSQSRMGKRLNDDKRWQLARESLSRHAKN